MGRDVRHEAGGGAPVSGPALARTTSRGRVYQHPLTGENAWSVTTILDALPKKALVGWAAREVAEFAVANRATLDAILSGVRLVADATTETGPRGGIRTTRTYGHVISDPDAVAAAVDYLKGSPYRSRERKADVGTLVHAEVEAHILGTPRPEVPVDAVAHMGHFRRFVESWSPEFAASEATVWNRTESYAGTLDFVATMGGRTMLVDVKTGKDVYPEVALQLCAYARAEFALAPDGSETPLPAIDGACVLHLTADGYRVVPVHIDDRTWDTFRYVREVFRWEDELSKRCLGDALAGPDALSWLFAQKEAA